MSETACFPQILNRQIDWPKDLVFDPALKDLVESLIMVNPEERLGSPGTAHDIYQLMKHSFFTGIDFSKNLAKTLDPKKALADQELEEMASKGLMVH